MNGGTRAKSGAHFSVRLALCTPVYGCCVRGTQRGTQANCGNYGDVLKWLRPLKTKGMRGIQAYSTVCNSYHGGRAHRSHRWGRWFESNCHHHESGRRSSSTLTGFFCVPLRVRTFRSQEYALFCQRGTQKGYADHLKTAYPCRRLVHINQ